jgi:hypothetical protein
MTPAIDPSTIPKNKDQLESLPKTSVHNSRGRLTSYGAAEAESPYREEQSEVQCRSRCFSPFPSHVYKRPSPFVSARNSGLGIPDKSLVLNSPRILSLLLPTRCSHDLGGISSSVFLEPPGAYFTSHCQLIEASLIFSEDASEDRPDLHSSYLEEHYHWRPRRKRCGIISRRPLWLPFYAMDLCYMER